MISERDGFLIPYRCNFEAINGYDERPFRIDPRLLEKGYTNQNSAEASGSTN
jgi:hypothetical protein